MTEAQLQAKLLKHLTSEGFVVFKTLASNINGVSDIIACSPSGEFWSIEVKAPGKLSTLSKLQEVWLRRVSDNGGVAIAVDSLEMLKGYISLTLR